MTRMVHAFPRESHNLLSVLNMNYRNRLSSTKQTESAQTGCACLEPGHPMMWLLGTSTICYYQEMAAEEHLISSGPHEGTERLSVKETLPHRTRLAITALQTFFAITIHAGSCAWLRNSLMVVAGLFGKATTSSGADQTRR